MAVTEVNGEETGVIEVKVVEVSEIPFGTNFWKGENEAVIYIRITDSNGNDITSDMIPIVATGYPVKLGDVTTPESVETGDVALVDGSFVSQDKIAEMTDAQKAAMVGVVFWTTKDTDPTGRTYPASLTDDKVMNADFPHCTHGLIVSLKNSAKMTWSNSEESVYENFQSQSDEYNPTTSDYVSVCQNNNDGADFYKIYGYQNTKVLKAYNDYCTVNNKTGYIMNPVASLASFSEQNSAPEGSTGWYLPSTKELNILCNEDVDEIWNNTGSMRNKNLLNTVFSLLGVDGLVSENYWSSSECDSDQGGANSFYGDGSANYPRKKVPDYYARYVCAF